MRRFLVFALVFVLFLSFSGSVWAQAWPEREVEIIIPWSAGGATDVLYRTVGKYFPKYANGKQLIIKNMPGGGSAVGYGEGAKAKPDGYTLVAAVNPIVTRALMGPAPYHPIDSFEPVCLLVKNPCYVLVNSELKKWDSLSELVEYVKENPGVVTVGNSGAGGGNHLVALRFENALGLQFIHVPFGGGGPSVNALLGGHIDTVVASSPEGFPNVEAGELEMLAVFAEERLKKFPQFPTAKEQGYDFTAFMWRGVVVPKGVDPEIIGQITEVFKAVLEDPDFQKDAENLGQNLIYLGPDEFAEHLALEFERYQETIAEYELGEFYK
ncbi:MAG: putative tricarboxylic transport rane protein [Candidatus Atribacteria bacterium]|nr:putative tricarboxylic transport rane protein [Candidatus Atribacteria bacterium]